MSLYYGFGKNDVDYHVTNRANGKLTFCPFYATWRNMIKRCYDPICQERNKTYKGCYVCQEWSSLSKFKAWMEKQDWKGKELDKDLLIKGNKVYSPETCVFITKITNTFTSDSAATRGEFPIGVSFNKMVNKFESYCRNPFSKKRDGLGFCDCPQEAHQRWKKRKHELACQLADLQTDQRVAEALRTRYL